MKPQIHYYYYLDRTGIDRLFAQSGEPYVEKVVQKKLKGTKGSGKTKFGIGQLFQWLGLLNGEIEGELSHEKVYSEELTYSLSDEHKLRVVLDALKEEKQLILITKDNFDPTNLQKSQFVELEGTFETPDPENFQKAMNLQNEYEDYISKKPLNWQVSHREGENYPLFLEFNCQMGKYLIRMGSSIHKYYTHGWHLRIAWSSRKVDLRVFGELTHISENEFYLKPFSIRAA